ncbi:unnamed protein product [Lepeophtheirus salmonis]|uniref:(salmon louse) hypothetical protein n=1 Tax=Lepeophtheirus salmonis TaxID=72036 RepID=A0A7R8H1S3_LEPSM|nr:unnamed protein product [Lepeophtheirus salmonis]CAF2815456.1 unnamed protein product [Lepeophtheirus salmonis]
MVCLLHFSLCSSTFMGIPKDQSLVEICVARLICVMLECDCLETIGRAVPELVSLLDACLPYDLRPVCGEEPSHADIASELLSCIFLMAGHGRVLQLTLLLWVQFLHKSIAGLSRSIPCYLSVVASQHAALLAPHLQPILDSILPHIYEGNSTTLGTGAKLGLLSLLTHSPR